MLRVLVQRFGATLYSHTSALYFSIRFPLNHITSQRCIWLTHLTSIDVRHFLITFYCALLPLAELRDDNTSLVRPAPKRMVANAYICDDARRRRSAHDDALYWTIGHASTLPCVRNPSPSSILIPRKLYRRTKADTKTPHGVARSTEILRLRGAPPHALTPTPASTTRLMAGDGTSARTNAVGSATQRWTHEQAARCVLHGLVRHCALSLCNSSLTHLRGYSARRIAPYVLGKFLARCQFKLGGIGNSPYKHPSKQPSSA